MKTKTLLLALVIGMTAVSCTNDYEFFDDGWESQSWETSLNQMVSQNVSLYSNNEIFLKDYREIDIKSLDSTSFINKDAKFPVFSGNHISLVPFAFINHDTIMSHVKAFHVKNLVNYSMDHKSELTAVKLTWESADGPFTSIALFDKKTGQLVYDNIIYNTITTEEGGLNKYRKFKLTRSEGSGPSGGSETLYGSDKITYGSNGYVQVNWTCFGYWEVSSTPLDYGWYEFSYTWRTSDILWSWSSNDHNGDYKISTDARWVKEGTNPYYWGYKFRYYMWIGTEYNPTVVGLAYVYNESYQTNNGHGFVKTYTETPTRSSETVYYPWNW